jgi:hypothetical protein
MSVRDLGHFNFYAEEFFAFKGLKVIPLGDLVDREGPDPEEVAEKVNGIMEKFGKEIVIFVMAGTDWAMLVDKGWDVPEAWFSEEHEGQGGQLILNRMA